MLKRARQFLRRLDRLTDRDLEGRGEVARSVARDTASLAEAIRRGGSEVPSDRAEAATALLEGLPRRYSQIDDRYGLLVGPLEQLFRAASELVAELGAEDQELARDRLLENMFRHWVEDESGFLEGLGEALLDAVTDGPTGEQLETHCVHFLRDAPVVFPPRPGKKLDLHRSIIERDRYRVERIYGELLARRGQSDYAVVSSRAHYRRTGDVIDLQRALVRAGKIAEALEAGRRALHDPTTPRRAQVERLHSELLSRADSERILQREIDQFVKAPTFDRWRCITDLLDDKDHLGRVRAILGEAEKRGGNASLLFELYLFEGLVLEADGLVATRPIDAHTLATAAERVMDDHPDRAAGWLLMAAHRLVKEPRAPHYEQAADWLDVVRDAAKLTGQGESFDRALTAFRDLYRRRPALLRVLDARGLN
jgi:hypothetical protein